MTNDIPHTVGEPFNRKPEYAPIDELLARLVDRVLIIGSILGFLVTITSILRTINIGWRPLMTLHLSLYLIVLATTLLRKSLSYRARVIGVVVDTPTLGAVTVSLVEPLP